MTKKSGKIKGHVSPVKPGVDGVQAPKLKGLERRSKSGRRATPRRRLDANGDEKRPSSKPESASLAADASALVARFYDELFELFPALEPVFIDSGRDEQRGKLIAAVQLILHTLHRQEERVEALSVLEQECRSGAAQLECNRAMAAILLELMTEFSGNAWTEALQQIRANFDEFAP